MIFSGSRKFRFIVSKMSFEDKRNLFIIETLFVLAPFMGFIAAALVGHWITIALGFLISSAVVVYALRLAYRVFKPHEAEFYMPPYNLTP